jgi:hypothetical protein
MFINNERHESSRGDTGRRVPEHDRAPQRPSAGGPAAGTGRGLTTPGHHAGPGGGWHQSHGTAGGAPAPAGPRTVPPARAGRRGHPPRPAGRHAGQAPGPARRARRPARPTAHHCRPARRHAAGPRDGAGPDRATRPHRGLRSRRGGWSVQGIRADRGIRSGRQVGSGRAAGPAGGCSAGSTGRRPAGPVDRPDGRDVDRWRLDDPPDLARPWRGRRTPGGRTVTAPLRSPCAPDHRPVVPANRSPRLATAPERPAPRFPSVRRPAAGRLVAGIQAAPGNRPPSLGRPPRRARAVAESSDNHPRAVTGDSQNLIDEPQRPRHRNVARPGRPTDVPRNGAGRWADGPGRQTSRPRPARPWTFSQANRPGSMRQWAPSRACRSGSRACRPGSQRGWCGTVRRGPAGCGSGLGRVRDGAGGPEAGAGRLVAAIGRRTGRRVTTPAGTPKGCAAHHAGAAGRAPARSGTRGRTGKISESRSLTTLANRACGARSATPDDPGGPGRDAPPPNAEHSGRPPPCPGRRTADGPAFYLDVTKWDTSFTGGG